MLLLFIFLGRLLFCVVRLLLLVAAIHILILIGRLLFAINIGYTVFVLILIFQQGRIAALFCFSNYARWFNGVGFFRSAIITSYITAFLILLASIILEI